MLELLKLGTVNLLELAALDTNEMVMVLVVILVLITQGAVPKVNLPAQARFVYELYRPGHRCVPYPLVLSPDQVMQLLDSHMLFGSEEHLQHVVSLTGVPEPFIGNKLLELLLGVHCRLFPHRKFHNSYNSICAAYAILTNAAMQPA